MERKNAKVIKAEYTGRTWSNANGTFHVHSIMFDNGDSGEYSSKSENQNKLVPGQYASYEFSPASGNFPAKVKPVQPEKEPYQSSGNGNGKYQGKNGHGNVASFALSYAKDVYNASQQAISATPMTEAQMFGLADRMHDWLKSKEA